MKIISLKEAQRIAFRIMDEAEKRRAEYFEKDIKVIVADEDIEEELLRMCRQQVSDLCEDLIIYDNINEVMFSCTAWAEAGEQIYAQWRGWTE